MSMHGQGDEKVMDRCRDFICIEGYILPCWQIGEYIKGNGQQERSERKEVAAPGCYSTLAESPRENYSVDVIQCTTSASEEVENRECKSRILRDNRKVQSPPCSYFSAKLKTPSGTLRWR